MATLKGATIAALLFCARAGRAAEDPRLFFGAELTNADKCSIMNAYGKQLENSGMEGFALGISCRDILSLLPVDSLRPAAGTDGLRNEISWVQHLESAEYIPWLKGGELVYYRGPPPNTCRNTCARWPSG